MPRGARTCNSASRPSACSGSWTRPARVRFDVARAPGQSPGSTSCRASEGLNPALRRLQSRLARIRPHYCGVSDIQTRAAPMSSSKSTSSSSAASAHFCVDTSPAVTTSDTVGGLPWKAAFRHRWRATARAETETAVNGTGATLQRYACDRSADLCGGAPSPLSAASRPYRGSPACT